MCWIPNPGIPGSKPLDGSNIDSVSHSFEVNQMSTRNSLWFKQSKLSSSSSSLFLRQLNSIHNKWAIKEICWYKQKRWFPLSVTGRQVANNHGGGCSLTWSLWWGIHTSVWCWTWSESLNISHGMSLRWQWRPSQQTQK